MVSSAAFVMAQAVEQHRDLHLAEGDGPEFFPESLPRRVHQAGVEGAADLEGQAPLGARRLGQFRRTVDGHFLAANDQLAGAVVVADLHNAQGGSLIAAGLQLVAVKCQYGGHAAVDALGCFGHGLAPEGCQLHRSSRVKDARRLQGGILSQGKSRHILRADTCRVQRRGDPRCKGDHAGLGILGLVDDAVRVVEADGFQVKIQPGCIESGAKVSAALIEITAHTGVLAALACIQKCEFH